MKEYADETEMPFGKHKGKKLANVPAEYLLWLYGNADQLDVGLKAYINANMQGLRREAERHKRK
jgi:uncharacterized protein (DUF3820 family)